MLNFRERHKRLAQAKLYLLFTPKLCRLEPFHVLREALRAGIDLVQIREKEANSKELLELSKEVIRITRKRALTIVNDRADIAKLAGADGVHLGQEDLPVEVVRKILGPQFLIGVSTHSRQQLQTASKSSADYLAIGPLFPTKTKNYEQGLGIQKANRLSSGISKPVFFIGGIQAKNACGLARIAFSSSVLQSENPFHEIRRLAETLHSLKSKTATTPSTRGETR